MVLPPLASLTRSCRAIRRCRCFNRFNSVFDGFGMSSNVPSDEASVCTQPRSRPMMSLPVLGNGRGMLTNTRLRWVQSTWTLVYGRIGWLTRTWMTIRQWSFSPGLTHPIGFMPVMTTTPLLRPVFRKIALPVLEALRQQTKPRPRWRDLKPGTRPPTVFFRLSPADHSVFSILSVDDNMGAGMPAIHEHRRRASLSGSNSATSGPPKGSLTQSMIPPASSLTGTLRGRCSRL